jgi:hypothetical protein
VVAPSITQTQQAKVQLEVPDHVQAIITILSLVNPSMCAAIFVSLNILNGTGDNIPSNKLRYGRVLPNCLGSL